MMKLLEDYGVGLTAFLYGIVQVIGIVWIYGLDRFCSDIEFMLKKKVSVFWKFTWAFATPITLIVSTLRCAVTEHTRLSGSESISERVSSRHDHRASSSTASPR